ncbi:double zinc ribbon domain-containing protein [Ferrovibrio sp.]|uniref:double zinc ribbon domain-containing protein n=1 Tax=Ferrovibrio sp. TaxID=1917215 RepID=UPI003D28402B
MSLGAISPLPRGLRQLGRWALDALLPPRCMLCGALVDEPGRLCAGCWPSLDFIAEPLCPCCGTPFSIPVPAGMLCGACLAKPPRFRRARAALVYGRGGRDLVLRFKRADRTDLALGLAGLMRQAGSVLLREADLILPVPLHRGRLWRRRYNQSALLAQALGRLSDKRALVDALERVKPTPSLGGLNRRQRREALAGAIRVAPQRRASLAGKTVLLVDDVYTTGATVSACIRALRGAGVAAVDVLTLTRVLRPDIV